MWSLQFLFSDVGSYFVILMSFIHISFFILNICFPPLEEAIAVFHKEIENHKVLSGCLLPSKTTSHNENMNFYFYLH